MYLIRFHKVVNAQVLQVVTNLICTCSGKYFVVLLSIHDRLGGRVVSIVDWGTTWFGTSISSSIDQCCLSGGYTFLNPLSRGNIFFNHGLCPAHTSFTPWVLGCGNVGSHCAKNQRSALMLCTNSHVVHFLKSFTFSLGLHWFCTRGKATDYGTLFSNHDFCWGKQNKDDMFIKVSPAISNGLEELACLWSYFVYNHLPPTLN